jgi:hypothetical protein
MESPLCGRATCDSPGAIRLLGRAPSGARRLCFGLLLHLFCLRMSLFASVLCTLEDILPDSSQIGTIDSARRRSHPPAFLRRDRIYLLRPSLREFHMDPKALRAQREKDLRGLVTLAVLDGDEDKLVTRLLDSLEDIDDAFTLAQARHNSRSGTRSATGPLGDQRPLQ